MVCHTTTIIIGSYIFICAIVMAARLVGKLEDGTIFERRGHDGVEPFEFIIDEG